MRSTLRSLSPAARWGLAALAALTTLLVVKIASMLVLALLVSASWASGDAPAARRFAELQLVANVFEPHKAHFNVGTAAAALGDLPAATDALTEALRLTPSDDECSVRVNLALVYEARADAATEAASSALADEHRLNALATLDAAPPACRSNPFETLRGRLGAAMSAGADAGDSAAPDEGEQPVDAPADPAAEEEDQALRDIREVMDGGRGEQVIDQKKQLSSPPRPVPRPW